MSTRLSTQTPLTCREAHQTRSHPPIGIRTRIIAGALGLIALLGIESSAAQNQIPLTQTVTASSSPSLDPGTQLEAVVEAVRSTTLSSQVAGSIVSLTVKAGDRVKAGQELLRIDARAAQQQVQSASAQLESARAALIVAARELERQRQLFVNQYISQGALDRAQGQWEMAQAQVQALEAQAIAAKTQSGFFVLEAPYSGVISDVLITLGDMAMPGRALIQMHDPGSLRITASVPQALLQTVREGLNQSSYQIPGLPGFETPRRGQSAQLMPTVDANTHTAQLRVPLQGSIEAISPGMFAKVFIPTQSSASSQAQQGVYLPLSAIVKRAELQAVYVLDRKGKAQLRQVRLGRRYADMVQILSGVSEGEQVVSDPRSLREGQ